ncbi:hypothetical protein NEIRO03_2754 [Nematocida sp. AWRm78]|nr:hypothetical protein NEIRO03_2754 [Nematocida sp. AWRm78]
MQQKTSVIDFNSKINMHTQEGLDTHDNIHSPKYRKKTDDLDKNKSTDDRSSCGSSFNNLDSVITRNRQSSHC